MKQEGAFFSFNCWRLFLTRFSLSSLLWLVPRWLVPTMSQNVLTCKFTINQLHIVFIGKACKCHYKVRQFKVGQILQIGTGIHKDGNLFNFGNLLLYPPNTLQLGILKKLKICYNRKERRNYNRYRRRIWVTWKSATLLKPFFTVDIFFEYSESLDIFLKKLLRKATEAPCTN